MMDSLEKQKQVDLNVQKLRIEEVVSEREKSDLAIAMLKEEMMEQSRKYTETIEILENQIALLKDKFMADISEIDSKINRYFEKNEPIKKSLQPATEKKSLAAMFESYVENLSAISQKDATIKQCKDKLKSANTESSKLKQLLQEKSEAVKVLQEELNSQMKKMSTYK